MINERTPQRNISKSMLFKVRNKTKNKSKISKTMFVQDFTYLRVKILASGCDFCHFTFQVLRVQRLNFNEGNDNNLPIKYVTPGTSQKFNIMKIE